MSGMSGNLLLSQVKYFFFLVFGNRDKKKTKEILQGKNTKETRNKLEISPLTVSSLSEFWLLRRQLK